LEAPVETEPGRRYRRRKRLVWIGGSLAVLGPVLGVVGTIGGMLWTYRQIEGQKAPTPGDLAHGVYTSLFSTVAGVLLGLLGAALFVVAKARLQSSPPTGEANEPWR
jgi:biopolymer transport protein ExbB/TolQ